MTSHAWRISLKPHLSEEQLQISVYEIAEELGMSKTTVYRFLQSDAVVTNQLSPNVALLAQYYGLDISDVVKLISKDDEDNEEGIQKRHLSIGLENRPISAQLIST